jgi:hypothetical protein
VLVPAEAVTAAEALEHRILRPDRGADGLEHAALVGRAVLVGEHGRRLGRERERRGVRVVGDEAARGLVGEPLVHVALVRAGACGERGGVDREAVGHRAVEAEALADQDQRHAHRGTGLVDHALDERLDAGHIDHSGHAEQATAAGRPQPEDS